MRNSKFSSGLFQLCDKSLFTRTLKPRAVQTGCEFTPAPVILISDKSVKKLPLPRGRSAVQEWSPFVLPRRLLQHDSSFEQTTNKLIFSTVRFAGQSLLVAFILGTGFYILLLKPRKGNKNETKLSRLESYINKAVERYSTANEKPTYFLNDTSKPTQSSIRTSTLHENSSNYSPVNSPKTIPSCLTTLTESNSQRLPTSSTPNSAAKPAVTASSTKSTAKEQTPKGPASSTPYDVKAVDVKERLRDVIGYEIERKELVKIVDLLKRHQVFDHHGVQPPTGILITGPIGVGKSLFANAIAGEAGIKVVNISGSFFNGQQAPEVYKKAKQIMQDVKSLKVPCVIILEEPPNIDNNADISNRIHSLVNETRKETPAIPLVLLIVIKRGIRQQRGNFDFKINLYYPDKEQRTEIIKHFLHSLHPDIVAPDFPVETLVRQTAGYTAGELKSLINHAAISPVIEKRKLSLKDLDLARGTLQYGTSKSKNCSPDEVKKTAYHEAGHALLTWLSPHAEFDHVTLLPRGGVNGYSMRMAKEANAETCAELKAKLQVSLGGRAAEEVVFGRDKVRTGAWSDFVKARSIAKLMVTAYGMSEKVGPLPVNDGDSVYLSEDLKKLVHSEMLEFINEAYASAKDTLERNRGLLEAVAKQLVEKEHLSISDMEQICGPQAKGHH